MKSQPDITIRRLAAFGGIGDLDAGTAWHRPAIRERQPAHDVARPLVAVDAVAPSSVVQLEFAGREAQLWHAA